MPKLTGPLLSLTAQGSIARTATYLRRAGQNVGRAHAAPSGLPTAAQIGARTLYANLAAEWHVPNDTFQESWTAANIGKPQVAITAFLAKNTRALKGKHNLADLVFGVRAYGGIDTPAFTVTAGSHSLTIAGAMPDPILDWEAYLTYIYIVKDTDPQLPGRWTWFDLYAGPPTYSVTQAGLTSGALYRVGAILVFNKPNTYGVYGTPYVGSGTPA
jgi:hypothetical protein